MTRPRTHRAFSRVATLAALLAFADVAASCDHKPPGCAEDASCQELMTQLGLVPSDIHTAQVARIDLDGRTVEIFAISLLPGFDCENGCGYDHFVVIRDPDVSTDFLPMDFAYTWGPPTPQLGEFQMFCHPPAPPDELACDFPSWHLPCMQNDLLPWAEAHPHAPGAPGIVWLHERGIIP